MLTLISSLICPVRCQGGLRCDVCSGRIRGTHPTYFHLISYLNEKFCHCAHHVPPVPGYICVCDPAVVIKPQ